MPPPGQRGAKQMTSEAVTGLGTAKITRWPARDIDGHSMLEIASLDAPSQPGAIHPTHGRFTERCVGAEPRGTRVGHGTGNLTASAVLWQACSKSTGAGTR